MRNYFIIFFVLFIIGCKDKRRTKLESPNFQLEAITLNEEQAQKLINLPLNCIDKEYPNKLGQTIESDKDLQSPKELHPSFYGCFDWHSSVHGHWSLVSLLKQFPSINNANEIKDKLLQHLSSDNILKEVEYFNRNLNKSYERTYGWAWLLKLAEELNTWDDDTARVLEQNLQPLTDLIVNRYIEFLPKLNFPIRVGEHTNTAFGLTFALDYANTVGNTKLKSLIEKRAKEFYLKDNNCPINWEPSGYDFLSPCLQEAALMKRVLSLDDYKKWMKKFLPILESEDYQLEVGLVSDRNDGKLVHLDGVNFSRAWCLYTIIKDIPEYNHLNKIANEHVTYSLPNLIGDNYEGGHWLGSFAIYALNTAVND